MLSWTRMSSVLVTSVLSSENLQTGKIETSTDCFKSFFFSLTNVDERRTHIWHSNRKRLGRDHSNKTRYSPQAGFLLGLSSQSFIFLISSGSRPNFISPYRLSLSIERISTYCQKPTNKSKNNTSCLPLWPKW